MTDYEDRLQIPIKGCSWRFYTKGGTHVATGCNRVVCGGRGPYIEFDEGQIVKSSFHMPEDQKYRKDDKRVYYMELRSNDECNVKLYIQKKTVAYADYRVGDCYISPFDLRVSCIEPLKDPS